MSKKADIFSDKSIADLEELENDRQNKLEEAGINEDEVLEEARESLNSWESYFSENKTKGRDDMNFVLRDQWTAIERSEFTRLFKPAMTFNKLNDSVKKVLSQQRQNQPDFIVRALNSAATQKELNLREDLLRTISYQSQSNLVFQEAFRQALYGGYGAFQVSIDYESPKSFNQIVKLNSIKDPFVTSFDPLAELPHKGDGNFCSRQFFFSKEEFQSKFPHIINPISYSSESMIVNSEFYTKDTIVVCDFFKKEWYSTTAYELSDGTFVLEEEWEKMKKEFRFKEELAKDSKVVGKILLDSIPEIKDERSTDFFRIKHYRLTQNYILDVATWPSQFLPIIFNDGDSTFIEGKQYTRSFCRDARDAQKFVNYVGSETAAEIKNRRREQWIGTPENIVGNEQVWRNPELQSGILLATPDPKTGQMPTKMPPWELSQSLLSQYQRGNSDIREILGFFEANLGQRSNETSGRALEQRQIAGSLASYVYEDNLYQAIEQAGRVILDLLPSIYGGRERTVLVRDSDGKSNPIVLNKRNDDGTISNEIKRGNFDVEINTGPSFSVQKERATELLLNLSKINPEVFPLVADLVAKNLDVQFMPQLVERFQNLVPPQVLAKEKGETPPPQKPSPQQQMMEAQLQIAQQQIKDKESEIEVRHQKNELEKAKLLLQAQQANTDAVMKNQAHHAEMGKARLDYEAQIAKILSDIKSR